MGEAAKWSKIAKLEEIMEKEERQRKRAAEAQKKLEYRTYLQQQALDKKNQFQEARDADRALDRIQSLANRQRMEHDEEVKKQEQEEVKRQQKEVLDSQIQADRVLRQTEQQETLAFGKQYAAKCMRELELEREALVKRKDAIREEGIRKAEEIEEGRLQKHQQKCFEREELRKWAFETYREEREEVAENKRAKEASRKAMEERALLVPIGSGASSETPRHEKMDKRAERLLAEGPIEELLRQAQRPYEEEERRTSQRRVHEKKTYEYLAQQVIEKEQSAQVAAEVERQYIMEQEANLQNYMAAEKQRVDQRNSTRKQHQQELKRQIETKKLFGSVGSKKKADLLNAIEITLNREKVHKVSEYAIA